MPVTVVVPTKNEERAILACLGHLANFDQVIVVDSQSEDRTQQLVREFGGEVVEFIWNGRYPKKKQWCLDNLDIKHDWVLFVDADERPSPALLEELACLLAKPCEQVAFDVPVEYHFSGRRLDHGHRVVKRALVRPRSVAFPVIDDLLAPGMGEQEGHYQPVANGPVGRTSGRLIHDDPDPIGTWVTRHNRYSDWECYLRSREIVRMEVQAHRSKQGRIYDGLPAKPLLFFLYSYILRAGWRDGRAGFDYAFALAFYYWLIDAKVRERQRRVRE